MANSIGDTFNNLAKDAKDNPTAFFAVWVFVAVALIVLSDHSPSAAVAIAIMILLGFILSLRGVLK